MRALAGPGLVSRTSFRTPCCGACARCGPDDHSSDLGTKTLYYEDAFGWAWECTRCGASETFGNPRLPGIERPNDNLG